MEPKLNCNKTEDANKQFDKKREQDTHLASVEDLKQHLTFCKNGAPAKIVTWRWHHEHFSNICFLLNY